MPISPLALRIQTGMPLLASKVSNWFGLHQPPPIRKIAPGRL
ncbi:hypothetical protein [Paludisphaera borealis]|nr:hypothetical protein [Paludisphaera borealis]